MSGYQIVRVVWRRYRRRCKNNLLKLISVVDIMLGFLAADHSRPCQRPLHPFPIYPNTYPSFPLTPLPSSPRSFIALPCFVILSKSCPQPASRPIKQDPRTRPPVTQHRPSRVYRPFQCETRRSVGYIGKGGNVHVLADHDEGKERYFLRFSLCVGTDEETEELVRCWKWWSWGWGRIIVPLEGDEGIAYRG